MFQQWLLSVKDFLHPYLPMIHKTAILAAAGVYFISTLFSISARSNHKLGLTSRLFLYNAAVMLIIAESARVARSWSQENNITKGNFILEIIGYGLLAFAACVEQMYNQGAIYMIGSFLVSIAKEINIVMLLVPKNQLLKKRYLFLSSLNSCCSALAFFLGALVVELRIEKGFSVVLSSSLNILSGLLIGLSIFYMLKQDQYDGYTKVVENIAVE